MLGPDRPATRTTRRAVLLSALAGLTGCTADGAPEVTTPSNTDRSVLTPPPTPTPTDRPTSTVERFDGPLAVPADMRARGRRRGTPLADFADLDRWRAAGATVETGPPREWGGETARLTVPAAESAGGVYREFPDGLDLSSRAPSLAVRPDEDDPPTGVYCQLFAPDGDNRVDLWQAVSHTGWTRLDLGPRSVVGDPNLRDVRSVGVRVWTGGDRARLDLDALRTVERPDRGAVMFTFDDGYTSQYDRAAPILADHDVPGVVAPIPDTVGDEGRVTIDQLHDLRDDGWTVVNHPQAEKPLPDYPAYRQRALMKTTKRWLLRHGFEAGADTVIWPYGRADATTLSIGRRYYSLGLSAGDAPSVLPLTDPLTVARIDGTAPERARRLIDLTARFRGLAVLVYHPVGTGADSSVSETALRETVAHAAAADLDTVTPEDLAATPP